MLNRFLLVPFISILVLPIAWFEGSLLPKTARNGLPQVFALVNAVVLYVPWAIAIIVTRHLAINPVAVFGFFMIAVGFIVLSMSLFPILRVPGQMRSLPERLVVIGPYRYLRHPIYLSHFLLIGGAALACGTLKVFLETPVVLGWRPLAESTRNSEGFYLFLARHLNDTELKRTFYCRSGDGSYLDWSTGSSPSKYFSFELLIDNC